MVAIIAVLFLLLLVCGRRSRPASYTTGVDPHDDVRENIIHYDEEGVGKCIIMAYSSSSSSCNLYSALILRQCSDSIALLQAYAEAIPLSEEGTFQIQPSSQQYC